MFMCIHADTDGHSYVHLVSVCMQAFVYLEEYVLRVYESVSVCVFAHVCMSGIVCTRVCLFVRSGHHEDSLTSLSTRMERAKAGFISRSITCLCLHFFVVITQLSS